ncbi:MAG: hypothetical protein ACAH59_07610 [Pseudobdellovibrionaceae bacterium]
MNLKRFWIFILLASAVGLLLTEMAQAQTASLQTKVSEQKNEKIKALEGTWNIRLRNFRYEDDLNQRNTAEFRLLTDLRYRPLENIDFRLAPKFTYTNGFVQTTEGSQAATSTWGMKEASINAEPFSDIWLSAGALDQSKDHPALLLDEQAFPAARLRMQTDSQALLSAGIKGETAIPTNSSLSAETKELEETPTYSSGSVFLKLQKMAVEGQFQAGVYEFQNLPSSLATKSAYFGNSITPIGEKESVFTYEYKGSFAAVNLKTHMGRYLTLKTLGEWVKNEQAPKDFNQAVRSNIGLEMNLSQNVQLTPYYEYFRIEPDAAVSYYNGVWLNTNRIGYDTGLSFAYKKTLKLTASGGERNVIFESDKQKSERTWIFKIETFEVAI